MSKGLYKPWAEMRRYLAKLKSRIAEWAAETGQGGRGMLATPLGNFVATYNARGEVVDGIEYVPTDGKIKGCSIERMIIDDDDVPGGMANPYIEAAKAEDAAEAIEVLQARASNAVIAMLDREEVDANKRRERESAAAWAEASPGVRTRVRTLDADNPITMSVKVAAVVAAEQYRPIFKSPIFSVGNNEPGTVCTPGNPAYFARQMRTPNWLCCVRKSDGAVIEYDSGKPSAGPAPKMEIKTVFQGDPGARSFFYIDHALVAVIMHGDEPASVLPTPELEEEIFEYTDLAAVALDYEPGNPFYEKAALIFANTDAPIVRINRTTCDVTPRYIAPPVVAPGWEPPGFGMGCLADGQFDHEAYHTAEAERIADQTRRIMGAFRLPPEWIEAPPAAMRGGFSIGGSLSPTATLRAQLTEAGARMLKTCGTCKGTGAAAGGDGQVCGTCRGSGSVAA